MEEGSLVSSSCLQYLKEMKEFFESSNCSDQRSDRDILHEENRYNESSFIENLDISQLRNSNNIREEGCEVASNCFETCKGTFNSVDDLSQNEEDKSDSLDKTNSSLLQFKIPDSSQSKIKKQRESNNERARKARIRK